MYKWHVCLGSYILDSRERREREKEHCKAKGKQGQGKRRRERSGRSLRNKWGRAREEGNEKSSEPHGGGQEKNRGGAGM